MLFRIVIALSFFCTTLAHAQALNCEENHTRREESICSSRKLVPIKIKLNDAYKSLLSQLSPAASAKVQSDHRQWLRWVDTVCPPLSRTRERPLSSCLLAKYDDRLRRLEGEPLRLGDAVFFPRSLSLTSPDKYPPGDRSSQDPGFGFGVVYWVEIDRPTAAQKDWSRAARLVFNEGLTTHGEDPSTHPSFVADCEINVDTIVTAANTYLIDVMFVNDVYSYGAHGHSSFATFQWLVKENRALRVEDIFAADKDWKSPLNALAVKSLRTQTGSERLLWDSEALQAGVAETASKSMLWSLDNTGLTIDFPEYAVAPYNAGRVKTTIPWRDLQPFLSSTFHPEALPAPTTRPHVVLSDEF